MRWIGEKERSTDVVVSATQPVAQLVTKDPGIHMHDENERVLGEHRIEMRRGRHRVVVVDGAQPARFERHDADMSVSSDQPSNRQGINAMWQENKGIPRAERRQCVEKGPRFVLAGYGLVKWNDDGARGIWHIVRARPRVRRTR